jgi:peptidyl-prolyl cis-trans isomerase C
MKLKLNCFAVALLLASSLSFAAGTTAQKSIARVNNVPVPASYAELYVSDQVARGATDNEELHKAVKEELIRRELLAQEAKKLGLDKHAEVSNRMDIARQGVLIEAYINEWQRSHRVTEAQIRAEYDRRVGEMSQTEYKVRHIQLNKMEDAQAVIAKLQGGAKFADLAKDSLDTGSASKGGDIGWVSPHALPKAFGEAVEKLGMGKYTTVPVQTQYGFHVIMVEDTRKAVPPTYEDEKADLGQYLTQQALSAHIDELLKKAKVE